MNLAAIIGKKVLGKPLSAKERAAIAPKQTDNGGVWGICGKQVRRYRAAGAQHKDPPPFDAPEKFAAWYSRMQRRGTFNKDLAKSTKAKIRAAIRDRDKVETPAPAAKPATDTPKLRGVKPRSTSFESLKQEDQYLREHCAYLRNMRDTAAAEGRMDESDGLDERYLEAFNQMTVCAKRINEIELANGNTISRSEVESELAPLIASIAIGGKFLLRQLALELQGMNDMRERIAHCDKRWFEQCQTLLTGQYSPPFIKSAALETWDKCAEWMEAQA